MVLYRNAINLGVIVDFGQPFFSRDAAAAAAAGSREEVYSTYKIYSTLCIPNLLCNRCAASQISDSPPNQMPIAIRQSWRWNIARIGEGKIIN